MGVFAPRIVRVVVVGVRGGVAATVRGGGILPDGEREGERGAEGWRSDGRGRQGRRREERGGERRRGEEGKRREEG